MAIVEISTLAELQAVNNDLTGDYELVADIDASATATWHGNGQYPTETYSGFMPLGVSGERFTGTFDGQGHTITGLYINRPTLSSVGLFGYCNGATISYLHLTDFDVTGRYYVGAMCGHATDETTTFSHCSAETPIADGVAVQSQGGYCGGFVGTRGTYEYCHAVCEIDSEGDYVGGFAGANVTATNCYAETEISNVACDSVGGFAGALFTDDNVTDSYSTGTVSGTGDQYGGFVGYTWSIDQVRRCYSTVNVTGHNETGGFVGCNNNAFNRECYAFGDVTGQTNTGGYCGKGRLSGRDFTQCGAHGDVTGRTNTGGFVGYVYYITSSAIIEQCYAIGAVSAESTSYDYIGGFVGKNEDCQNTICWCSGDVTGGRYYTGGFVGRNVATDDVGKQDSCKATGNVTSDSHYVGGFAGYNEASCTQDKSWATGYVVETTANYLGGFVGYDAGGTQTDCYYTEIDASPSQGVSGNQNTGGFVGYCVAGSTQENCYCVTDVSSSHASDFGEFRGNAAGTQTGCFYNSDKTIKAGSTVSQGSVTGETTANMQSESTFTTAGWDIDDEATHTSETWKIDDGNGYPEIYMATDFWPEWSIPETPTWPGKYNGIENPTSVNGVP